MHVCVYTYGYMRGNEAVVRAMSSSGCDIWYVRVRFYIYQKSKRKKKKRKSRIQQ